MKKILTILLSLIIMFMLVPMHVLIADDYQDNGEITNEVTILQSRIDALPNVDEVTSDKKSDIYNEVESISDELDKLAEEDLTKMDTRKLYVLSEYFNGLAKETVVGESDELPKETITIDLSQVSGYITISPTGFSINGGTETSFTGKYTFTGTIESDTPLRIINNTDNSVEYDLTFDNAYFIARTYCTAIAFRDSNADITLNITNKGTSEVVSYNHPVFANQTNNINIAVNINETNGSRLNLSRSDGKQDEIIFYDNTNTIVKVNGNIISNNASYSTDTSSTYVPEEDEDIVETIVGTITPNNTSDLAYEIKEGGTYNVEGGDYSCSTLPYCGAKIIMRTTEPVAFNIKGDITVYGDSPFIINYGESTIKINAKSENGTNYSLISNSGWMLILDYTNSVFTFNGGNYQGPIFSYKQSLLKFNGCNFNGDKTEIFAKNIEIKDCNFINIGKPISVGSGGNVKLSGNNVFNTTCEDIFLSENATITMNDDFTNKDDAQLKIKMYSGIQEDETRMVLKDISENMISKISLLDSHSLFYKDGNAYLSHSYSDSIVNSNVLIKKCSVCNRQITFATLTAEDIPYSSGASYNGASVTLNENYKTTIIAGDIKYKKKDAQDTEYTTIAPTAVGEYSASVTVTYDSNEYTLTNDFKITNNKKLISIVKPDDIKVFYGTEYNDMNLPTKVTININTDNEVSTTTADVTWDYQNLVSGSYDSSLTTKQNVTLKGTLTLPEDVDSNSIDLSTTIDITIMACPELIWADKNNDGSLSKGDIIMIDTETFWVAGVDGDNDSILGFAIKGLNIESNKQSDSPSYVNYGDGTYVYYINSYVKQYSEAYGQMLKNEYGIDVLDATLPSVGWQGDSNDYIVGRPLTDKYYSRVIEYKPWFKGDNGYWLSTTYMDVGAYYVNGDNCYVSSANGNKLKVRPLIKFRKSKVKLIQTIVVETTINDWTYGQNPNTPSISEASNPGNGSVTFTYYTDESCTNLTTINDGAESNGTVPKNVGVYYVKTVVERTDAYTSGYTINKFKITKATKDAPIVNGTNETFKDKKDGSITGVDSTMEYRKDGTSEYIAIEGNTVTGLEPGAFYVRYKESRNYNASQDAKVTIEQSEYLLIERVEVNITTPKGGEDLNNSITCTTANVKKATLKWTDTVNRDVDIKANFYPWTYKAHVTISPEEGYKFNQTTQIIVNGNEMGAEKTINEDDSITVTGDFESTKHKLANVASLSTPTQFTNFYTTKTVINNPELPKEAKAIVDGKETTLEIIWSVNNYDATQGATNKFNWTLNIDKNEYDIDSACVTFGYVLIKNKDANKDTSNTNKDSNLDCKDYMKSDNWIWSETKKACVYKVPKTSVK